MVKHNATKLELPPGMKIHPVFNVALLKRYHRQSLLPNPILVDGDAEYKVERILKHRGHPCHYQYLLRWKVYGPEEDMWVPEVDLEHAHEMLMQYKAQHQLK